MARPRPVGPREAPAAIGFAGVDRPSRSELLAAPVRWPRPALLERAVDVLPGLGRKRAEALAEDLGIERVWELQWLLPARFEAPPPEAEIAELAPGKPATVLVRVGTVGRFHGYRGGRSRGTGGRLEVTVSDSAGGSIRAVWFNQPWVADRLVAGQEVVLTGRLEGSRFVVSAYRPAGGDRVSDGPRGRYGWPGSGDPDRDLEWPVGVYPATARMPSKTSRRLVRSALSVAGAGGDPIPVELRRRHRFPGRAAALRAAGFPSVTGGGTAEAEIARRRLAFEELLLRQLTLQKRRTEVGGSYGAKIPEPGRSVQKWLGSLGIEPTEDQHRAMAEIDSDLGGPAPMQRLLMGEVGSGKTLVAAYAMLRALEGGWQAAYMAPTTVLVDQHAGTLAELFGGLGIEVLAVTGALGEPARREVADRLAEGDPAVVVGTHALLEDRARPARLGLVVIDEQHRFGVAQRAALSAGTGRASPHCLHMTATPIPRTLAVHHFGDLDSSVLRELPRGRLPVETEIVPPEQRAGAFATVRDELARGRQAIVVCPLVEESGVTAARAVESEAERLARGELHGVTIDRLHGRMSPAEKTAVMRRFADGETAVIVATTVVEVGIDVPNATVIAIEGADRFGLAQLHQLRGRVGRGRHPSKCLLLPGAAPSGSARARLRAMVTGADGFELAEVDLGIRGAGEILGARQSGPDGLLAARLPGDHELLEAARSAAADLFAAGPFGGRSEALGDRSDGGDYRVDRAALTILLDAAERRFPGLGLPGIAP